MPLCTRCDAADNPLLCSTTRGKPSQPRVGPGGVGVRPNRSIVLVAAIAASLLAGPAAVATHAATPWEAADDGSWIRADGARWAPVEAHAEAGDTFEAVLELSIDTRPKPSKTR